MRVRWVAEDASRPGGVESVVRALHEGLTARGVDSSVLSWLEPHEDPGKPSALSWVSRRARAARRRATAARAAGARVAEEITTTPDLVVILDPGSIAVARHLRGAPRWGVHVHWSPDMILRPWRHTGGDAVPRALAGVVWARLRWVGRTNRRVLRCAPFLVSLTRSHTRTLMELQPNVVEVGNPVSVVPGRARGPVPDDVPVTLGYVGRLAWEKGPDLLLDALTPADDTLRGTRLVMAGSGPLEEEVHRRAEAVANQGVSFLGWVDDPAAVLATLDVFVLPSRSEGVPLVLIEALGAGCRVVAAAAGTGVVDVLEDGRLGAVVPVDDARALRQALIDAVAAVRTGRTIDQDGVADVVRRHDPEVVLDTWFEILTKGAGVSAPSG